MKTGADRRETGARKRKRKRRRRRRPEKRMMNILMNMKIWMKTMRNRKVQWGRGARTGRVRMDEDES